MDSSDPEATSTPSNSCETFLVLAARVEKDRLPGSYCLVVTVVVLPSSYNNSSTSVFSAVVVRTQDWLGAKSKRYPRDRFGSLITIVIYGGETLCETANY